MKQTEIGLIPDDWEVKKLSDVSEIKAPMVNPMTRKYDFLPHIGNENIEKYTGKLLPYNLVGEDHLISGKYYFKSTDVLYGKINPQFSKVAFPEFEGLCSADMYPLSVKEGMIPLFLKYSLLTKSFYDYTVSSSTRSGMPKVNRNEIAGYLFAFPPLPEQQRIAKALSDMDALISTTEKLIQKKKNIKQGTMQNLLTGKKRLPGFGPQTKSPTYKQTELGPIPEDWEVKTFGDYVYIVRGGSPRPIQNYLTTNSGGINWIKIGDVKPEDKYIVSTEEKIIPEGKSRSREVHKGDFILSNSMSFGRPYILQIDGCIHDGWLAIQNYQENFDSDFLYYLLGSDEIFKQYIEMAAGSSVQNLNKEKVAKLLVPIFDKKEQTAIASVLSSMDKEIETLNTKLEKYRNLKTAMMQQLLTGKIRLR